MPLILIFLCTHCLAELCNGNCRLHPAPPRLKLVELASLSFFSFCTVRMNISSWTLCRFSLSHTVSFCLFVVYPFCVFDFLPRLQYIHPPKCPLHLTEQLVFIFSQRVRSGPLVIFNDFRLCSSPQTKHYLCSILRALSAWDSFVLLRSCMFPTCILVGVEGYLGVDIANPK